jgi:hypothetical protein
MIRLGFPPTPNPMAQYGYFDDAKQEFVITRPDTPLPWLNYARAGRVLRLCTQTAGGYSFWKDARLRRLTRYRYNNNPMDNDGRFLYVKQGKTVWNPGWKPVAHQARRLRVPARPGLHEDHGPQGRGRGRAAHVRPAEREPRGLEGHRPQQDEEAPETHSLLVCRVLLLRGAERHDELPAHLFDRRGRDRGERDLPQDRVPRAPQPLHALSAARGR